MLLAICLIAGGIPGGWPASRAPLAAAASAPQFPPPGPKRKIVFGMPVVPPNVVHTPAALARDLGLTDKFNIDLEIKDFEGSTRALAAAITGDVQVGTLDCLTAFGNGSRWWASTGRRPSCRWSCSPAIALKI